MDVCPPNQPKKNRWKNLKQRLAFLTGKLEDRPPKGDFTNLSREGPSFGHQHYEVPSKIDTPPIEEEVADSESEWDGELPGLVERNPSPPPPKPKRYVKPASPRPKPYHYVEPETTAGIPARRPTNPKK